MVKMVRRFFIVIFCIILILSGFTTAVNIKTSYKKKTLEKPSTTILDDIIIVKGGHDDWVTSVVVLQFCGREWNPKWNYYYYFFNLSWYQAKFDKNGKKEENPYVILDVDLYVKTKGIVYESDDVFDFGGWNVQEREDGDFSKWAELICTYLLASFPSTYTLAFTTGLQLAKALRNCDDPNPEKLYYRWRGQQIYEASGFCKFHCYVPANTDFSLSFRFHFWESTIDLPQYREYDLNIYWNETSPEKPIIKITYPQPGYLYLLGRKIFPITSEYAVVIDNGLKIEVLDSAHIAHHVKLIAGNKEETVYERDGDYFIFKLRWRTGRYDIEMKAYDDEKKLLQEDSLKVIFLRI
jgi:hypothetical protein